MSTLSASAVSPRRKPSLSEIYEKYGLFVILIGLCVLFTCLNPNFFSLYNLQNIFKQSSINGLIAFGMTFVILLGCIDLSVGSVLALVGYLTGVMLVNFQLPIAIALPVALALGIILGLINGLLVARVKLQPFIATLITMTVYRGLTLIISDGMPVRNIGDVSSMIAWINRGSIGILPVSMIVFLVVLVILMVLLHKTVFGRQLYATGGNEEAARLSTVPTDKIKILGYMLCGLLSAMAAILYIARYNSIYPNAGVGMELDAIAAVVIGGTSMTGGRGRITGTFIGVLIIGVLNNGLNLLGISSFYQEVIKGLVILFAVVIDIKKK
ncbi:ribose ABC transporter permease RbsC [Kistimonas scapharcae]|uniref:Ribose ABC transporter permease RbsC n=1 Tax=Kistimonas scapharcae TaxID=1036133 RepID=A0ABP8V8D8_9GAMM